MSIYDYMQNLRIQDISVDNIYQKERINSVEVSQSVIERNLNDRINKLTLVVQAMWTIIEENTNLSQDDLMKKIEELDLADGKLDSTVDSPKVKCPECDAVIDTKHGKCQFCGYQLDVDKSSFEYE